MVGPAPKRPSLRAADSLDAERATTILGPKGPCLGLDVGPRAETMHGLKTSIMRVTFGLILARWALP